ncbi:hypothetical protein [Rhizobium phage RHph_X66]|nr:hypothetical protein [Rhizobium phage RHph_X66]
MTEKMEPVHPGDLEDLLKSAFAAGLGMSQSQLDGADSFRWREYRKRPVPISVHQRVEHALARSVVTDEMVERAAKALEKKIKQSTYEWTDDEFEIWWNKDPYFVSHETGWGDEFGRGTRKNHLLWETRISLEAALHE